MFEKLLAKAKIARKNAYSPFSKFQVGASILSSNNNYYVGSSIENPSFSQTLCAEASAIAAMVTAGERKIKTILVVGGDDNLCFPCGGCRQKIKEFSYDETKIYVVNGLDQYKIFSIDELLPNAFTFSPKN